MYIILPIKYHMPAIQILETYQMEWLLREEIFYQRSIYKNCRTKSIILLQAKNQESKKNQKEFSSLS